MPSEQPTAEEVAAALSQMFSEHQGCTWIQVGDCVCCGDHFGVRLYQGELPEDRKDRGGRSAAPVKGENAAVPHASVPYCPTCLSGVLVHRNYTPETCEPPDAGVLCADPWHLPEWHDALGRSL
jgi:hypothetical protein